MKLFNLNTLYKGKIMESIYIKSFDEYKDNGGKMDMLDTYAHFKSKAKQYESDYISMMDMSLSGIPVKDSEIIQYRLLAQVFWTLLSLWFNKPLRKVSYSTFNLNEFDKL